MSHVYYSQFRSTPKRFAYVVELTPDEDALMQKLDRRTRRTGGVGELLRAAIDDMLLDQRTFDDNLDRDMRLSADARRTDGLPADR